VKKIAEKRDASLDQPAVDLVVGVADAMGLGSKSRLGVRVIYAADI